STARISTLLLSVYLFLWVVVLQLPRIAAHPGIELNWLGLGEDLSLATGGWVVFFAISRGNGWGFPAPPICFWLGLVPIGLSHFFYLAQSETFVPSWLPFHMSLSMLSGAGHIAAGIAIASGIVRRLAATLEAVMVSLITLIVWTSALAGAPTSRAHWV